MIIPFVDLVRQYNDLQIPIDNALEAVFSHGQFIKGEEVEKFEVEFARFLKADYCVGVNSGTDALILGLRALNLPKGCEIIVPVHTFIATALAATENDFTPVFVDADPNDYGMDLADLRRKITTKTAAIITVHLYGQAEKIGEIREIIKRTGRAIHLVEDACQAHGATYGGQCVGTFSSFSAFSFYPGKNLGAFGDAGAVVTNNKDYATKVRLLREYGQEKKYHHTILGINSRLDTIQAAVLRTKLRYLKRFNRQRQKWARYYTKRIMKELPEIVVPNVTRGRGHVFHLYVIEVENRDSLLGALHESGIHAQIHYPVPLHLQKSFAFLDYNKGDFPNAERLCSRILSLPIYPELEQRQADFVVDTIKKFYEKK